MKPDIELFGKPYLGDPELDRLAGMVFVLAGEVAVLKAEVARLSGGGAAAESSIAEEIQAFAREVLTPLVDFDRKPA